MENESGTVAQTIGLGAYKDNDEEDPCEKCPERQFYPNCDSNVPCPFRAGLDKDTGEEPLEPEGTDAMGWQYRETKDVSPEATSYKPEEQAPVTGDGEEEPDENLAVVG